MCTITFFPINSQDFIVTDNRDEALNRLTDLPRVYQELKTQLYYAKDKEAGGTWMGVSRYKHLICLMNGAFAKHQRKSSYRKSRGIVVKELLATADLPEAFTSYDFINIEPFFAVALTWDEKLQVLELVWDGVKRHLHSIPTDKPLIWSSAMSYGSKQREERKQFLADFIKLHPLNELTVEDVFRFHQQKGNEKQEKMVIDRGFLKTTSISQFSFIHQQMNYHFKDLITQEVQKEEIVFE